MRNLSALAMLEVVCQYCITCGVMIHMTEELGETLVENILYKRRKRKQIANDHQIELNLMEMLHCISNLNLF